MCVCVCMCVLGAPKAAYGQQGGHCCLGLRDPLPGLSSLLQKGECHQLKNESTISKAIKDLAEAASGLPTVENWVGGL